MKEARMKAIITGAASGIGKAVAFKRAEAQPDTELLLVDRQRDALESVAHELCNIGKIEIEVADLLDSTSADRIVAHAEKVFGGVDSLVSNAGYGEACP